MKAPVRLPLAGGASIRFRRIPGPAGKVVITGPDARFLMLDGADFEALERGAQDAANSVRRKLEPIGFLHSGAALAASRREAPNASNHAILDADAIDEHAWDAILARGGPITLHLGEPPRTRPLAPLPARSADCITAMFPL